MIEIGKKCFDHLSEKYKARAVLLTEGGGMYLIFPVIVIVLVIVLLQCLSYSFGQN